MGKVFFGFFGDRKPAPSWFGGGAGLWSAVEKARRLRRFRERLANWGAAWARRAGWPWEIGRWAGLAGGSVVAVGLFKISMEKDGLWSAAALAAAGFGIGWIAVAALVGSALAGAWFAGLRALGGASVALDWLWMRASEALSRKGSPEALAGWGEDLLAAGLSMVEAGVEESERAWELSAEFDAAAKTAERFAAEGGERMPAPELSASSLRCANPALMEVREIGAASLTVQAAAYAVFDPETGGVRALVAWLVVCRLGDGVCSLASPDFEGLCEAMESALAGGAGAGEALLSCVDARAHLGGALPGFIEELEQAELSASMKPRLSREIPRL